MFYGDIFFGQNAETNNEDEVVFETFCVLVILRKNIKV